MLFLAVLEALAFVALIPLMQLLTAPDMETNDQQRQRSVSDLFGNPSPTQLAPMLAVITVGVYIVKSIAAVVVLRWATTFALAEETKMLHRLMGTYLERVRTPMHLSRNSNEFVRTLEISLPLIFRMAMVQSFNAVGDIFSVAFVGRDPRGLEPRASRLLPPSYFAIVIIGYQHVAQRFIARAATRDPREAGDRDCRRCTSRSPRSRTSRCAAPRSTSPMSCTRYARASSPRTARSPSRGVTPAYVLELAMMGAAAVIAFVAFSTEPVSSATATVGVFLAGGFRMLAPLNKIIFGISQTRAALPSVDAARRRPRVGRRGGRSPRPWSASEQVQVDVLRPRLSLRDVSFSYVPGSPRARQRHASTSKRARRSASSVVPAPARAHSSTSCSGCWSRTGGRGHSSTAGPSTPCGGSGRARSGMCRRSIVLFDATVRANVAFGVPDADIDDDQVWKVLELAQLADVVRELPDGLDDMIGESGVQLSGGQRQRLGVARALYHDPQILMFDEATSALDNETEFKLTEVLESFRGQADHDHDRAPPQHGPSLRPPALPRAGQARGGRPVRGARQRRSRDSPEWSSSPACTRDACSLGGRDPGRGPTRPRLRGDSRPQRGIGDRQVPGHAQGRRS